MGAVISKVADWWRVSIAVDVELPAPVQFQKPSVGVDLGISTLATLSDGTRFENQEPLRTDLHKLKRLHRALSRRKHGSHRWWKGKRQLARCYCRIANKRTDVLHKMTTQIAKTYCLIGVENLHVKGMVKNRHLALSIADVSMGSTLRQLAYKSAWYGGQVVQVGRFYASSKTCAECGTVNHHLRLSERTWVCHGCSTSHDRDWNASKNIEFEALRLVGAGPLGRPVVATSGVIARGQDVRPGC